MNYEEFEDGVGSDFKPNENFEMKITKDDLEQRDKLFCKQEAVPGAFTETGRKELFRIAQLLLEHLDLDPARFQKPMPVHRFKLDKAGMNVEVAVRGERWSYSSTAGFTQETWPDDCCPTAVSMEFRDLDGDWLVKIELELEIIDQGYFWIHAKSASGMAGHGDPQDVEIWLTEFKLIYE